MTDLEPGPVAAPARGDPGEDGSLPPPAVEAARTSMAVLRDTADVFETFFDAALIGLALADLSGRYVRVNTVYAALLGRSPEDLVGEPLAQVVGGAGGRGEDSRELPAASLVRELLAGSRDTLESEQPYRAVGGHESWVLHAVATVTDDRGRPAWFAVSAQDITERRRVETELRALTAAMTERAVRDPLTGLANRSLLEERLRGALAKDARSGTCTGLLFLDLDGFKAVNDDRGHATGDAVLQAVAARLSAGVRPSDTVARLGGDEFVVLVEQAVPDGLTTLAARLRAAVAAPIEVAGVRVRVGVSIGSALSVAGADDPSGLLSKADREMYRVKRRR